MRKFMEFWGVYYPIILAFLSFVYSVTLWFSGDKLEGIFVGIWVPSILSASVALRQKKWQSKPKKKIMENIGMFIMGCIVCALYLTGYLYMIKYANDSHDSDLKKDIEKANKNHSKNSK